MLRWTLALLIVGLAAGLAFGMPPQCSPEVLEEIDNPKIREICHFLQTYAEAVEGGAAFVKGGSHYPLGLIDNGVKRQDVDHVFLRFGRRRR
ncbi:myosuppressin [Folsomia candida]|nr:myosuppressin [Folsomia candida]